VLLGHWIQLQKQSHRISGEKKIKKGLTELVSDGILDGGEWMVKKVSAGWKKLFG
jgi:hypothetical protein